MRANGHRDHPSEGDLEQYSRGCASEADSAYIEEHLLICEACRERLDLGEAFEREMPAAAAQVRRQERRTRLMWMTAAAAALLIAAVALRTAPGVAMPAVNVNLEAIRGPLVQAPAGRPLRLRLDLSGLAPAARYEVEMVDTSNRPAWQGTLDAHHPQVLIAKRRSGTYFVRVYSPARELLREYGLELRDEPGK